MERGQTLLAFVRKATLRPVRFTLLRCKNFGILSAELLRDLAKKVNPKLIRRSLMKGKLALLPELENAHWGLES